VAAVVIGRGASEGSGRAGRPSRIGGLPGKRTENDTPGQGGAKSGA
jgi:hypothetical protein